MVVKKVVVKEKQKKELRWSSKGTMLEEGKWRHKQEKNTVTLICKTTKAKYIPMRYTLNL